MGQAGPKDGTDRRGQAKDGTMVWPALSDILRTASG